MSRFIPALILLGAACATEYSRRIPASDDPANPAAPGSEAAMVGLYETPPAAQSAGGGMGHAHHAAEMASASGDARDAGAATLYTCPMHPEFQQSAPGRCPKCGMTLVPENPR